jgi:hypothetical protein
MPAVSCPNCLEPLNAPADAVGKAAKCAACGHRFVIDKVEGEELDAPMRRAQPELRGPFLQAASGHLSAWRRKWALRDSGEARRKSWGGLL